ncbi:MAG: hypothetical protein OER85_18125 [Gammaproteobacteria bacterium]|nr:hypothetical protein [Gammaproteobacteria bacterium]
MGSIRPSLLRQAVAILFVVPFGSLAIAADPAADAALSGKKDVAATTEAAAVGPPAGLFEELTEIKEVNPCEVAKDDQGTWLDKSQTMVYETVCGSVAWFDGFFGDRRYDQESGNTFGRIGLSTFWDQRDGFNTKFRFRARFALPELQERASLLIGRGDEQELIEERPELLDTVPGNFNSVEDDSFLVGLGYSRGQGLKRGFDFSVGAKLRLPPEPYVKAAYRRAWELSESTLFRIRPLVYWRYEEGLGSTLNLDLDHLLTKTSMVRWSNSGNVSQDQDVEGVRWLTYLSLFRALSNRRALSYHLLAGGETEADVRLQNYGFEVRYRQRVLREWLFIEFLSSLTWPREFLTEERESNFGAGIGIEMYFGPIPQERMY